MAIAFDDVGNVSAAGPIGTATITNHTIAGSDRLLMVGIGSRSVPQPGFTSLTIGGSDPGFALFAGPLDDATAIMRLWVYYLIAPPTGTNDIVLTLDANAGANLMMGSISLTGVDQSTPFDGVAPVTHTQASGGGTSITTQITPATADAWVVDFVHHRNDADITSSQTNRLEHQINNNTIQGIATTGPINPAALTTMTWSDGADQAWNHILAAIRPAAGGAAAPVRRRGLMLMGVGMAA